MRLFRKNCQIKSLFSENGFPQIADFGKVDVLFPEELAEVGQLYFLFAG